MRVKQFLSILVVALAVPAGAAKEAPWVSLDAAGKLVYRTLPRGDRIADFSYAGYMGGGVPLPHVAVARTIAPSGSDDTAAIQHAIDEVSALPVKDGFRGTVLLAPGTFQCSGTLNIAASGVVLRGSGTAANGTTLKLTGDPHVAISIAGEQKLKAEGTPAHIAQAYVPSGAQAITLDDASAFAAGDIVRITRFTTPQWLRFMGMDKMVRDGKPEVWVGNSIVTTRRVTARQGNVLTLDVPLTDSYDRAFLPPEGAEVVKVSVAGGIEQDGVESLRIAAPARSVGFSDPLFRAMNLHGVRDGWVRDLAIDETTEGIDMAEDTSRITVQDVAVQHTTAITSSAKPADFSVRGGQSLLLRCSSVGDEEFYVITGARNQGPNVVLDSTFRGNGHVQPHQRWATGLLVDNVHVPGGGIDLMNRGQMGTGHGWTMGWGVVWNSSAATLLIQNPPGAANWSIGNTGEETRAAMKIIGVHPRDAGPPLPQGYIESPGHAVAPASLYRAQLAERLGAGALKALEP
jgi:Pectate lyase superfamily protein